MVSIAVIGASGYTGGEILRILAMHREAELVIVTSREHAGKPISLIHPNLRGYFGTLKFSDVNLEQITSKAELVFVNLPHGASLSVVPRLMESGVRVIDLSADFRLRDASVYEYWYENKHVASELLQERVYGLPELYRGEIRRARLVACPGCNSTATILALAPAVKKGIIDTRYISVDVKVGSSEAGRQPSPGSHHPERANVMRPYEAGGHRHVAEVEQELSLLAGSEVRVALVPHAVGSVRGVLATCHVWLRDELDEDGLWRIYAQSYGKEPFIRIVRGGRIKYPDPKYVIGSNYCDVGFAVERRIGRAAIFGAIDNLMKGAAGQAVQCMNIMLGIDEAEGLRAPPIAPI